MHAFDPSVGGLPNYAKAEAGLHYHKAALAAHTNEPHSMWPVANSLLGHMQVLGHTAIDVLKIDCEGCEWDVFDALLEGGGPLPFNQLLIELHLDNATGHQAIHDNMFKFFEGMEARGFRAYAREVNIGPTLTGQLPVACEYSFIRNKLLFPLQPAPALIPALMPPKLKAAIYVLLNARRLSQLTMMLQQLHDNFNKDYQYPIVLFHDEPISDSTKALLTRDNAWSWIRFETVELSLSALEPDIDPAEIPEVTECAPTRLFYRHMCRFHSVEASRLMSAMGYEWHWRLDDDSRLSEPVGYDVFQLMATNNMLYSYLDIVQEEKKCYTNLWDLAELHLSDTHREPTFYNEWPEGVVFYNNFEISHQSVWQSPEVSAWMDTVRKSRGIYLSRWGDAPIRTLAVSMFVDPMRVHRFSDLAYTHAPLFKQTAATLPILGLGAVQSALCTHIKYWDLPSNASAMAQTQLGCNPLINAPALRFHVPSDVSNKVVQRLGDGMMQVCSPTHLSDEAQSRCALPVEPSANPAARIGNWQLSYTPAPELDKLLSIQRHGMLGTDIATTIPLPSPNGTKRTLWLLGDTPWGSYDEKTCARQARVMPRNALAVTTDQETCFHLRQGEDLLPIDLFQPKAKNNPKLYQQHWWWLFAGLTIEKELFLLGADFWLAPHTMWYSQGTLVFIVSNPEAPVHDWKYTKSYINKHPDLHWYGGVARQDEWVYLVGSLEDESTSRKIQTPHGEEVEKGLVLSRIRATDFQGLSWTQLEYWDGATWDTHEDPHSIPPLSPILYHTGGGETTLQWDDRLQMWYMLFVQQQDHNKIIMHYSRDVQGPWESKHLYSPAAPFTDTENYMCYAVKSHQGLAADMEIIFSFVCTKRPWTWPGMTNVYVPHFVRVKLSPAEESLVVSVNDAIVEKADELVVRMPDELVVSQADKQLTPRVSKQASPLSTYVSQTVKKRRSTTSKQV